MTDPIRHVLAQAAVLTEAERAELVQRLWDTLPADSAELPMPAWHRAIVDARLAEHRSDPEDVVEWDDALERLQRRSPP
ncbi:MAG: addiction module protein [Rhodospirillales bacterium]|nr:addiction module protein [Rhodospirillales bacterium]